MRRVHLSVGKLRELVSLLGHKVLWCGAGDGSGLLVDTEFKGSRYRYTVDILSEYDSLSRSDIVLNNEATAPGSNVSHVPINADFFLPLRMGSALGINPGGDCYPGCGKRSRHVNGCVCGYDIELNMEHENAGEFPLPDVSILSCALWCSCGYEAFFTSMKMEGNHITGSLDSCSIVELVIEAVKEHEPQWLVGWNNISFDNTSMHFHAREPYKSMFKQVKTGGASVVDYGYIIDIEGVYNADPYAYFQRSPGHNYSDMSLAGVAKAEGVTSKMSMPDLSGKGDPIEIMEYNITDSKSAAEIWMKTGVGDEIMHLAVCSCAPIYDCIRHMTGVIWSMAVSSQSILEGKIMDWSTTTAVSEYAGGTVLDPVLGVHDHVVVVDFSSMYPTIMIDGRISPETVRTVVTPGGPHGSVKWNQDNIFVCLGDITAAFPRHGPCLQSEILRHMVKARSEHKKTAQAYATALKVTANSGYGAMGYPNSPMYAPTCAASVTAVGRHFLSLACEVFKSQGLLVLYGDTDSCMLSASETTTLKYSGDVIRHYEAASAELARVISSTPFPSMKMTFESYHPRVLFLGKKKYCKLNTDGTIQYKGVSVVRSDTLGISKHCFVTVSGALLKYGATVEAKEIISRYVCRVVECALDNKFTAWDVSKVKRQDGKKCYMYYDRGGKERSVRIDVSTNTVEDYDTLRVLRVFRDELLRLCTACRLGSIEEIVRNSSVFL